MRMSRASVLLVLVMAPGCGNSRPPSPLAPSTAATPQVPLQQQSVFGYVGDTAFRSVAGARVEVLDGPQAGMTITADANGLFSYSGAFASAVTLRASKDGYLPLTRTTQTSAPGGRPWVYFQLDLVAPPVDIAGDYTLTLIADDACAGIPNELRTRTYPATITIPPDSVVRAGASLFLTVGGAQFVANHNGFPIGVAGDEVGFSVYYKQEDFGLVEQVTAKTFLAVQGSASASVGTSPVSTISAPLDGMIDYCALNSESGWNYDCVGPVVAHERCQSKNHRLILTRR
jgi:hypothetical protein